MSEDSQQQVADVNSVPLSALAAAVRSNTDHYDIALGAANDAGATEEVLAELAESVFVDVCRAVAKHPATPQRVLLRLCEREPPVVAAVLRRDDIDDDVVAAGIDAVVAAAKADLGLGDEDRWWVRTAVDLVSADKLTADQRDRLATAHPESRRALVAHRGASASFLQDEASGLLATAESGNTTPIEWAAKIIDHPNCGAETAAVAVEVALNTPFDAIVDVLVAALRRDDLPDTVRQDIAHGVRYRQGLLGDVEGEAPAPRDLDWN